MKERSGAMEMEIDAHQWRLERDLDWTLHLDFRLVHEKN
jgi:hypothetical protein